ncbi:LCP family protein [Kitasatospora purpeofusca]|uniref:LCP family protein n=1 Tax=Kitasatospora purpeofusca TaxID=67352 RepID=UPI002250BA80|nr:LCP family protein [Kitasatospora purpeofusca]MCX4753102.1 LCP family protein [Kitasatospora purpeofusca]WSR32631.1 LCP family protein [Kitasatospora purpeofusca]WSR40721.1 LCP family protein [Kitasatospora purpeofusca]
MQQDIHDGGAGADRHPAEPARGIPVQRRRTPAEAASEPPHPGGRAARRRALAARRTRRRRILKWTGGLAAFALVAGCGGAYYAYQHFNNNITAVKVQLGDEAERPKPVADALNILVIGTDSREGLGREYGDEGSTGHADTTLLFHIAKDRSNATALSIPRDLMVPVPECQAPDGKTIPGTARTMFNNSLGQDGRDPGCTWKTVEKVTGIRVDHFVMVNFDAVKTLSTAVGGVEVCAAKDINDPDSHLRMSKGRHVVQGDEALAFVRTRHAVGLGGDLTRIPLQQQFIGSMIRSIKSSDTLTNPAKLWKLADSATKALTVDSGIGSVDKLKDLALDLSKVDSGKITFATVPVLDDPADENRLVLKQPDAAQLFSMVGGDRSLTGPAAGAAAPEAPAATPAASAPAAPAAPAAPGGAASAAAAVDAKDLRVTVRNGTGTPGQAQQTVDRLVAKGYAKAATAANVPAAATTSIAHPAGKSAEAAALAAALGLPAEAVKADPKLGARDGLVLVLGKDAPAAAAAEAAATPATVPSEAPKDLQRVQGDDTDACAK